MIEQNKLNRSKYSFLDNIVKDNIEKENRDIIHIIMQYLNSVGTNCSRKNIKDYVRTFKYKLRPDLRINTFQVPLNKENPISEIKDIPQMIDSNSSKDNILIIGDLHIPFEHDTYFDFCKNIKKKYQINKVIFIGDILDNHYSSFHPTDPDGFSAGEELKRAKHHIKKWHTEFPNSIIILGNHDRIISRQAFANGISSSWIRSLGEVLETPTWNFVDEFELNNTIYTHGTNSSGVNTAYNKALYKQKSVVMGHLHSQSSIIYVNQKVFGMIVGCGIEISKYAFNYMNGFNKPVILSCGVIIDGTPIIETMK